MDPQSNPHQAQMRFVRTPPQGLLGRIITFLISATLLVIGAMFSFAVLAFVAVAGIGLAGWFWWKTRAVRKAMRQEMPPSPTSGATVIDGECIRETVEIQQLPR